MLSSPGKVANLPKGTQPTLESHIYVSDTTEGRKLVANPYFHMVDPTGQQLPYISRQDELYANDNEVRILKLVNGEADYKSQSLTLASAPLLLENQEKGDYTVHLRPQIASYTVTFNVTSEDLDVLATMATEQWTGRFNPKSLSKQDFKDLYRKALENPS